MRRTAAVLALALAVVGTLAAPSAGRDRPFNTSRMIAMKLLPSPQQFDLPGLDGGQFSKVKIERFRCTSSGNPNAYVDISCNDTEFGQHFAPDNEIAIAVNPENPEHLVAGSNDYYYRFNNATGARQAIVPTGFFTSFDGGVTWIDGQVPMRTGNGAGDPAPYFDAAHDTVMMAQLENVAGQGGFFVSQGNVSVSRSTDGGVTWSEPVTVFKGQGAGIGPANKAVFWDKEYITVDNNPTSDYYGRAYVVATKFVNGIQGAYTKSPIALAWSDDGGVHWSRPKIISGSHPSCSFQETGSAGVCDEDQFGYPVVAPDGTVYVHFHNYQNDAAWEEGDLFDAQIMVVKSTNGGATWDPPVQVAQVEDGFADMPFSVIFRQTVWGHQIRWTAAGNISVSPVDQGPTGWDLAVVWTDRGTPNDDDAVAAGCIGDFPGTAPNYDPCNAGPGSDLDVWVSTSSDGGANWSGRTLLDNGGGASQWFPWAGHKSDGTLVVAWDEDTAAAPADTFRHQLKVGGAVSQPVGPEENLDVSVTHWAGQYTRNWPAVCGPAGYGDDGIPDAAGKDCNVFHGDYTGLAVDSSDRIHIVWTGLNRHTESPQIDFYTGAPHDGYAQDAMYARR